MERHHSWWLLDATRGAAAGLLLAGVLVMLPGIVTAALQGDAFQAVLGAVVAVILGCALYRARLRFQAEKRREED